MLAPETQRTALRVSRQYSAFRWQKVQTPRRLGLVRLGCRLVRFLRRRRLRLSRSRLSKARLSRRLRIRRDHFVVAVGIADFDGPGRLLGSWTRVFHDVLRASGYFGAVSRISEIGSFNLFFDCFSTRIFFLGPGYPAVQLRAAVIGFDDASFFARRVLRFFGNGARTLLKPALHVRRRDALFRGAVLTVVLDGLF